MARTPAHPWGIMSLKGGGPMKDEIRQALLSMAEPEYREFSAKLMPTVDKETVLGIRAPVLRKYAKSLTDYEDFLADLPHKHFDENNLHGLLLHITFCSIN